MACIKFWESRNLHCPTYLPGSSASFSLPVYTYLIIAWHFISAPCVVPKIDHGRSIILESTNETISEFPSLVVAHNERLSIDCENNYEMALNNTPVQCVNGTWSHIPTCVPGTFVQHKKSLILTFLGYSCKLRGLILGPL